MDKERVFDLVDKILESFGQLDTLLETVDERDGGGRGGERGGGGGRGGGFKDFLPEGSVAILFAASSNQMLTCRGYYISNLQ